jgi:hypothetical protein
MANYFQSLSKYCLSVYYSQARTDTTTVKKRRQIREQQMVKPPKKPVSAYILYYGEKYA